MMKKERRILYTTLVLYIKKKKKKNSEHFHISCYLYLLLRIVIGRQIVILNYS